MTVKLGDRAIYRPRVPYGRQSELFCFVTRIVDVEKGIVDLIAFPANSEPLHLSNIVPLSEAIQIHCWELHEDDRRAEIPKSAEQLADEAFLEGEQWTPEQQQAIKRGPGRPRKAA